MKKLTAYAAIFGAVAAITGFFGQNLPYPGFGNHAGLAVMAILLPPARRPRPRVQTTGLALTHRQPIKIRTRPPRAGSRRPNWLR